MKVISTQKQVITLRFNNEGIQYSYACYYLSEWKAKKGVKTTTTINLPNPNPTKILKNLDTKPLRLSITPKPLVCWRNRTKDDSRVLLIILSYGTRQE
jgi:hypothetical protein